MARVALDCPRYLEEADVQFFCRNTTVQIPLNILVIVAHNTSDEIRSRYSFRSLRRQELSLGLDKVIDIRNTLRFIGNVIVCYKVNLETSRTRDSAFVWESLVPSLQGPVSNY
jgi:hypothetical protein